MGCISPSVEKPGAGCNDTLPHAHHTHNNNNKNVNRANESSE